MKQKTKDFIQHLYHDIEDESNIEKYIDDILPLIGLLVMYFNGMEQWLDKYICEIFTDRSDSTGLIVLHKMSYATKVDLFKRFCDDMHHGCDIKIDCYNQLIHDLRESGRLRNLVVHADWEHTDDEGFTYVNLKISKTGMVQEYVQFSEASLKEIINLVFTANNALHQYWEERREKLYR